MEFYLQLTNTSVLSGAKQHSLPEELITSIKEILRGTVETFQAEVVANVSIYNVFNPFMLYEMSRHYQLDESISNLKGVG